MIRIAVCDIDAEKRKTIKKYCHLYFHGRYPEYRIFEFDSGEKLLQQNYLDVLLMGIEMKEMDGILVKDVLAAMKADTRIIFISDQKERMHEAFGRNVYGFLSESTDYDELCNKFKIALDDLNEINRYIFCKEEKNIVKVYLKDILYIESYGKYSKVHVQNDEIYKLSDKSMGDWNDEIDKLDKTDFASCHRRYIVNLFHVVKIKSDVELSNNLHLPIGRKYAKVFQEKHKDYLWRKMEE